jgi:hypothetical protein
MKKSTQRKEEPAWSWEDYRQVCLEVGEYELGVKRVAPGPPAKTLSARPKAGRPAQFSRG